MWLMLGSLFLMHSGIYSRTCLLIHTVEQVAYIEYLGCQPYAMFLRLFVVEFEIEYYIHTWNVNSVCVFVNSCFWGAPASMHTIYFLDFNCFKQGNTKHQALSSCQRLHCLRYTKEEKRSNLQVDLEGRTLLHPRGVPLAGWVAWWREYHAAVAAVMPTGDFSATELVSPNQIILKCPFEIAIRCVRKACPNPDAMPLSQCILYC